MGDLTKNLSRHEYECKCGCGFDTIDYKLVDITQKYADYLKDKYEADRVIVNITSGNRCKEHNETVQKEINPDYVPYSSKSTHMKARAEDVKFYIVKGNKKTQIPSSEVYEYFDKVYLDTFGIGLYHNRTHIDTRSTKARWEA